MKLKSCILTFSILFWVIAYNVWQYTTPDIYYIGTAQLVLVCSWLIHVSATGIHKVVSRVFLFLALNNLLDELFFDPTKFDINEFVMFALFFIHTLYKWKKSKS